MGQRKTTIQDVAAAAQVSVATVDRVLNGRGGVRQERARRVLEWARKLKIDRALDDLPMRWLRIAILIQNPSNPYHGALKTAFQNAQRTYEAQRVMCLLHYFDSLEPAAVARAIHRASEKADGLVILSYDHPRITAALKTVSKAIPIVTVASDLPASGRIAYVGSDNRVAGRVAGELMGRFLGPQGGDILVVSGMHDFIGHEEREGGFRAVLRRRFPNCEVVATVESQEQQERTEKLTRDTFKRFPNLRGIYNISVGSRGISSALRGLGKAGEIVLISHEMTDVHRELLTDGLMDAVLDQNPQVEALRAVQLLLHYNRRVPDTEVALETPVTIYLRENLPQS
ncbi:MAG TPA: LacI family DNA-binding transcriptional regulator [Dongiaceae bacterium]|jgi:LacI family transcriptional regulator